MRRPYLHLPLAAFAFPARATERARMATEVVETSARWGTVLSAAVTDAMRKVPRHLFVPEAERADAYQDCPLPIGHDATISSPSIVALMTELLDLRPGHRLLEIGTGSGYQAAILSGLVREIFSVEIVEQLAQRAAATLTNLGFSNVSVRAGDGYAGWQDHAPFDRVIVTAAAPYVPQPLLDQLKPGGRMVIPVGPPDGDHRLVLIVKDKQSRVSEETILPVRFVPLQRS